METKKNIVKYQGMIELNNIDNFLFYTSPNGKQSINVVLDKKGQTVWLTQQRMSELFNVDRSVITKHLSNIYNENELDKDSTCANFAQVQTEGQRQVTRNIEFYNLDAIISVGYRVNSVQATHFRKWASSILKEYLIKGFVLDDDRLKQGNTLFGKDYFNELLERIQKIRASERRFYQKITDIYAQCSVDYDPKSIITKTFFATVQNKLEFAITHLTAPEIIKSRADSTKPFMNLKSFKNQNKDGIVLKSDITTAKNYLDEKEIGELNTIVSMYLDYAELQAKRNKIMKMSEWVEKLDSFLKFNEYDILKDAGKVRKEVADKFAEKEYEKFKIIQDKEYVSDFDKVIEDIKTSGSLPKEKDILSINALSIKSIEKLSDFNKKLKKGLKFDPNADKE